MDKMTTYSVGIPPIYCTTFASASNLSSCTFANFSVILNLRRWFCHWHNLGTHSSSTTTLDKTLLTQSIDDRPITVWRKCCICVCLCLCVCALWMFWSAMQWQVCSTHTLLIALIDWSCCTAHGVALSSCCSVLSSVFAEAG